TTFTYKGLGIQRVNLTNGGDFQGRWDNIHPFGMNVYTEKGEQFLSSEYIYDWRNDTNYPDQPIFTFFFSYPEIYYV
ncbi:unnamed protein product, partial [marine sediment metagenome]